jgi:hypothetical protein
MPFAEVVIVAKFASAVAQGFCIAAKAAAPAWSERQLHLWQFLRGSARSKRCKAVDFCVLMVID